MIITMAKLRMANVSMHGTLKPPVPKYKSNGKTKVFSLISWTHHPHSQMHTYIFNTSGALRWLVFGIQLC